MRQECIQDESPGQKRCFLPQHLILLRTKQVLTKMTLNCDLTTSHYQVPPLGDFVISQIIAPVNELPEQEPQVDKQIYTIPTIQDSTVLQNLVFSTLCFTSCLNTPLVFSFLPVSTSCVLIFWSTQYGQACSHSSKFL